MSYFIPTSLQKRLIRYVLSRLEILDTDALGLENLELTWGKKSIVKLKDVSIHTQKIAALLKLPRDCSLSSAKIEHLRISIPADLHHSGILIEVKGITLQIGVAIDDLKAGRKPMKDSAIHDDKEPSEVCKANRQRSTQSQVHDPGGLTAKHLSAEYGAQTFPGHSPDPNDLAQSFLQTGSENDKRVLESALLQSQNFDGSNAPKRSHTSTQNVGVGLDLSLPAFLADFLRGVIARVQVSVTDIRADLVLQLEPLILGPEQSDPQPSSESLIFRFLVSNLMIGEVRTPGRADAQGVEYCPMIGARDKSRRVTIDDIQVIIISDSPLPSRIAQSSSHSTIHTAHSSALSSMLSSTHDKLEPSRSPKSTLDFEGDSGASTKHGSSSDNSTASIHSHKSPYPVSASGLGALADKIHANTSPTNSSGCHLRQPTRSSEHQVIQQRPMQHLAAEDLHFPASSRSERLHASIHRKSEDLSSNLDRQQASAPGKAPNTSSPPELEDLTQSRLYTHDEAVSMYTSAMEQPSPGSNDKSLDIPGAWTSTFSSIHRQKEERILAQDPGRTKLGSVPREASQTYLFESRTPNQAVPPSSEQSYPGEAEILSVDIPQKLHLEQAAEHGNGRTSPETAGDSHLSSESKGPYTVSKTLASMRDIKMEIVQNLADVQVSRNASLSPSVNHEDSGDGPYFELHGQQPLVVHLTVGATEVISDMAITKTTLLILQHFRKMHANSVPEEHRIPGDSEIDLKMDLRHVSWRFVDSIKTHHHQRGRVVRCPFDHNVFSTEPEQLLRVELETSRICYRTRKTSTATQVAIGRFHFGYPTDDIISFDSTLGMKESSRESVGLPDGDVSVTIKSSGSTNNITFDMTTLPLHVSIDLRRLDETFEWFGGISSMIDLGTSVASTVFPGEFRVAAAPAPKKRSVRFGSPGRAPISSDATSTAPTKVNVRLGGLYLELQGQKARVRLKSSAIKIVRRSEGIGIQIDRLKVGVLEEDAAEEDHSSSIEHTNVRIEYLTIPKEVDLARLIELVFPSKLRDEDQFKDGLMVDTLLRQRRQGGVVRITVDAVKGDITDLGKLKLLTSLFGDMKKLSTVAKYLPEDDRPGLLVLTLIKMIHFNAFLNPCFGTATLNITNAEIAFVTLPSLMALGIQALALERNGSEEIIHNSLPLLTALDNDLPVILARYIGNEMTPVVRVRMHDMRFEYQVPLLEALSGVEARMADSILADLASSITTPTPSSIYQLRPAKTIVLEDQPLRNTDTSLSSPRIDIVIRDSLIGLKPREDNSKAYLVIDDAQYSSSTGSSHMHVTAELNRLSLMITDCNILSVKEPLLADADSYVEYLKDLDYVLVGTLLAPRFDLQVRVAGKDVSRMVDAEVIGGLLLLESCADSTQTLQSILNRLSTPVERSPELKYRTEAVPVTDMLASFSGDAFNSGENGRAEDQDIHSMFDEEGLEGGEGPKNNELVSGFYDHDPSVSSQSVSDNMIEEDLEAIVSLSSMGVTGEETHLHQSEGHESMLPDPVALDLQEQYFGKRQVAEGSEALYEHSVKSTPLRAKVRNLHIIWNLFDGFDWRKTRDRISQAVVNLQNKASEQNARRERQRSADRETQHEDVIGDFLFNSIYIGIPANTDPSELARRVNRDIDDLASETGSHFTTYTGSSDRRNQARLPKGKRVRLGRSKDHKMTFELKEVSCEVAVYSPARGELQSSINLRIQDLEIFDHLPTSTWKKFATYMQDAGERENGIPLISLKIDNVRPIRELEATEILLKATILPLRLHVDQDALDFVTRFFEFKDESVPSPVSKAEAPFIQRAEINAVKVKLDFKPKRVDYAGLRSGHTTEFMNFFVLDRAEMILRHVILYGISGFDRLGKTLNDIWMPDVKHNQLPGVLAGVGPIRSLVGVGGGVRDLVVVPIREYQKDGRIVRSFQKGALAFAKTTTSELAKLGARLAIGTQTVLQGAEQFLTQADEHGHTDISKGWDDAELDPEEQEQISLYADQPVGVIQGLRGAYASLERDLLTTRDAIIAMPGEVLQSESPGGAARAVLRKAPTVILRPAVGMSKAVGQTLMGATNSLDPANRRRVEDKYKRH